MGVSDITLAKTDQIQITPTVGPAFLEDVALDWSVTEGSSVTVEDGLIKAVGIGDSVVTATHAKGASASLKVSVKDVDVVAGRKPVADSIRDMKLENSTSLKVIGTLSSEDFKALNAMKSLTSLDLSGAENVILADEAFIDNTKLTSIVLPDGLTAIGAQAFAGTAALKSIELPSTVKVIHAGAFALSKIESIKLNEGLEEIQVQAFASCTKAAPIELPSTLKVIGDSAFQLTKVKSSGKNVLVLPSSLQTVGSYAFSKNNGITAVILPESIKQIYNNSFPDTIGKYTFKGSIPPQVIVDGKATINKNANVYVPKDAVDTYKSSVAIKDTFDVKKIQPISQD